MSELPHAVEQAARAFVSSSVALTLEPLGRGLINDTYRVSEGRDQWVLQRINRRVFPDPVAVMANVRQVTDHAARERRHRPDMPQRLPEVIPTRAGADVHRDEQGEFWRAITYIDNTHHLPRLNHPQQAEEVGRMLGWFHCLAGGLPAASLHDTLPGFHMTPGYLAAFDAVQATRAQRTDDDGLAGALAFVEARRAQAAVLESAREQGTLSVRVIHGDPKLDNVLFDRDTGRAVSLIDLDTVKPGLPHYDLGDCCRSCCNLAGETAGAAAVFDLGICAALLRGYWQEAASLLTASDRDYLFEAIRLLPFELGLRFLTDHLAGDLYFKVATRGENLVRARRQFELVTCIEAQAGAIIGVLKAL